MKIAKVLSFFIILLLLLSLTSPVLAAKPDDNPGKGPPELEQIVFIHYLDESNPAKPDKPPKPDKPGKPGDRSFAWLKCKGLRYLPPANPRNCPGN